VALEYVVESTMERRLGSRKAGKPETGSSMRKRRSRSFLAGTAGEGEWIGIMVGRVPAGESEFGVCDG
jgi:hypothetical protein